MEYQLEASCCCGHFEGWRGLAVHFFLEMRFFVSIESVRLREVILVAVSSTVNVNVQLIVHTVLVFG